MATIKPLFIKDRSTLLQGLGMKEANESTQQKVSDAILEVRTGLYERLGKSRIDDILTTTDTTTPSTNEELVRARGNAVERSWCRMILLRVMGVYVNEGASASIQEWNDEDLARQDRASLEAELRRLQSEINEGLDYMQGDPNPSAPNVSVIGPTETNKTPHLGSGIFG